VSGSCDRAGRVRWAGPYLEGGVERIRADVLVLGDHYIHGAHSEGDGCRIQAGLVQEPLVREHIEALCVDVDRVSAGQPVEVLLDAV
jgi:hypothetical protein